MTHSLRIFLCHSSGDKPAVRSLYCRLKGDGFQPWLDEEDLLPGKDWRYEIQRAVRASDVVIVCLSSGAVSKRGFVQKETVLALDVADEQPEGSIFVIPLRLEKCDVPARLRDRQWVNLYEADGYQRLSRALGEASTGITKQGERSAIIDARELGAHNPLDLKHPKTIFKNKAKFGVSVLFILLAAALAWKLRPIIGPKLPKSSPKDDVNVVLGNQRPRSEGKRQEASPEKRSDAQTSPPRENMIEVPKVEPKHPSGKILEDTRPLLGPEPNKNTGKYSDTGSATKELARVEVTDVGGNKSILEITSSWNDMVAEVPGMGSVSWSEKLLLTNSPMSDIYQIPWLEIPLHPFQRSNILEFMVIDKPLIVKAKESSRNLTFYPVKIVSASGNAEAGYYWNAVRIGGKCTLKSGLQVDCQFPASRVKSIVFLQNQNEMAQSSSQRLKTEEQGSDAVHQKGVQKLVETTTVPTPRNLSATDNAVLEIVDLDGKSVLLSDPSIAYPGGFGPSSMTEGIAVRRGIEESTLLWSGIRTLKFKSRQEKNDKGTTVWRYAVDATLEDGRVVGVELRDDWNMAYMGGGATGLLFGQTDLGKTSIPFSKISLLKVLKHKQAKK